MLKEKTDYRFPILNGFLSGYATDMYFDTLTHENNWCKFRSEAKKIRKRLDLIHPSSTKKKILSIILKKNMMFAYLISRVYNALNR